MTQPTFITKFLGDGSSSMVCRQTGDTYLIGSKDHRGDCYCYREGEFFTFGARAIVLNAIETDARWSIRVSEQHKLALTH